MNELDIAEAKNEISRCIASLNCIIKHIDHQPTIDRIVSSLPIVWRKANRKAEVIRLSKRKIQNQD